MRERSGENLFGKITNTQWKLLPSRLAVTQNGNCYIQHKIKSILNEIGNEKMCDASELSVHLHQRKGRRLPDSLVGKSDCSMSPKTRI